MLKSTSVAAATLAAAFVLGWLGVPASAAPTSSRPDGGGYGRCIDDSLTGGSDYECSGAICSCCYTDGCFICENNPGAPSDQSNCHWEPPYHLEGRTGGVGQPGDLLQGGAPTVPWTQRPTVQQEGTVRQ